VQFTLHKKYISQSIKLTQIHSVTWIYSWKQEGAPAIPSLSPAAVPTATAKGNLDDDAVLDIWTIDQNKTLQNTVSDITSE